MNAELFGVAPAETAGAVRGYLQAFGITGAPVIGSGGAPVGFVSIRDLVDVAADQPVSKLMTTPVDTIDVDATVRDAALSMAQRGRHHLVVVDERGRATGFIGSLDVLRAVIGEPVPHPEAFVHYDDVIGLCWTNDRQLSPEGVTHAPDRPGLFRIIRARVGHQDRVVWAEGTRNIRERLQELLAGGQPAVAHLAGDLERGLLRYRAAEAPTNEQLMDAAVRVGARTSELIS
jgi:CBS domain-containing protein